MGKASQLKAERRAVRNMEVASRAIRWRDKSWSPNVIKPFIPSGDEAIATRYDPNDDTIYIACASGTVVKVERAKLSQREAEVEPAPRQVITGWNDTQGDDAPPWDVRIPDEPLPSRSRESPSEVAKAMRELEVQWDKYQKARLAEYMRQRLEKEMRERECRCIPPGEQGSPDAPPCKQHPNGDGKQTPPAPAPSPPSSPDFTEQWEMAEARRDEAVAAGVWGPSCGESGCGEVSEVALVGTGPRCGRCARLRIDGNLQLLDWALE